MATYEDYREKILLRNEAYTSFLYLDTRGFLTAAVLTFAHTVGEFGVVLMLGAAGLLEGYGRQLVTNTALRYAIALLTGLAWAGYFYAPRRIR